MYRTKTCGELNINNVEETVELAGWIQKIMLDLCGFLSDFDYLVPYIYNTY